MAAPDDGGEAKNMRGELQESGEPGRSMRLHLQRLESRYFGERLARSTTELVPVFERLRQATVNAALAFGNLGEIFERLRRKQDKRYARRMRRKERLGK